MNEKRCIYCGKVIDEKDLFSWVLSLGDAREWEYMHLECLPDAAVERILPHLSA